MKILSISFLVIFCLPLGVLAEDMAYVVAADFSAEGKVLELDVPPEIDGMRIFFIFENSYSEKSLQLVVVRGGRHCYEVRQLPEWHGKIKYVAVSAQGVQGRVKEPTFGDNMDMFF